MGTRPATPADAEAISAVGTETWHAAYDDIMGRDAVTERTDEWYDPDHVRGYFDDSGFSAYVYEREGEVVGYAYGREGDGDIHHLPAIYVRPAAQGSGVGSALAEEVEADARAAGAERVRLVVLAENDDARVFYESRGYERVGERAETTVEGTTELIYEKRL